MTRRVVRVLAGAGLLVVLMAAPAAADPAKPGDYRSYVTRTDPAGVKGVTVKVVGGDGFLDVSVERGHDVVVLGYEGGPWLHIRPDGEIEENQNSPATYINKNRYGSIPPDGIDANSEKNKPPEYKQIASGGTYAWHDHRIHWMSPQPEATAVRGQIVPGFEDWKVPMIVDGTAVTVHGQLVYAKTASPIPWFVLALLIAAGAVVLGRGKSTFVAGLAALLASVAALETGIVAYRSIPSIAGPNPLEIGLPAVATVAAVAAVLLHRKPMGVVATLLSVAALSGWAIMRVAVLFKPILPTDFPFGLDRGATAAAFGCSVAAAVLAVRSGALVVRLPTLDFDDEEQ